MTTIAGAVQSVDDSASGLRQRFRGNEARLVRLFRAQLEIDEVQSAIAQAGDPDGAVGVALTADVLRLSADVSLAPADGSDPFDAVVDRIGAVFTDLLNRLR